jgi:hypothetical protein
MSETQTTDAQPTRPPVAKKGQWTWFLTTLPALIIGGLIGLLIEYFVSFLLPPDWQGHGTPYLTVLHMTTGVAFVGAVLAGTRRYWGPMWAYIGLAVIGLPLIWFGVYSLFTAIF